MSKPADFCVLVVDDDPALRDAVAFDMEREGFQVRTAAGGKEALETLKREKIHLVVSDIRMPEGDGMSLLKALRDIDPTIPVVILMTGYSDVSVEEAKSRGAYAVLSKPFKRKALYDQVIGALKITGIIPD